MEESLSGINISNNLKNKTMTIKGYILSIALGIVGFCSTLFGLFYLSIENATLDKNLIIVDSAKNKGSITVDTIHLYNNELSLERHKVSNSANNTQLQGVNVFSYSEVSFNLNPHYLLWMMIIGIGIGLAFASLPILSFFRKLSSAALHKKDIRTCGVLSIVTIVLILGIAQFSAHGRILSTVGLLNAANILFIYPGWVLGGISALSLIPNFICLHGNYCIVTDVLKSGKNYDIKRLLAIHGIYSKFLATASLFLGFGVLSSHYLRLSVLDVVTIDAYYLLPQQFVVVYSLVFTFFLILLYLPGELLLTSKITSKKRSLNDEERENVGETITKQSIFKTGLSLLAPALLGLILEAFKIAG